MKVLILIALALCSLVQTQSLADGIGENIKVHLGPQVLNLHAGSEAFLEEDQLLAQKLTDLERSERSLVANAIYNLLEGFRDVVINGNDDLPPLDPLHATHIGPFEHTSLGVRIRANIHDFDLQGLRWYVIDHVTFNALRLSLGLRVTIPWIILTGRYDAFARVALISHEAGGNYRIFINRLETSADIRMGTNILGGGTLLLREFDIRIVVHDVTVQINGMVGSSVLNNLINSIVQNAAQNLLVNEMETISQRLSEELFDIVNDFLADFTLDDLLG